MLVEFFECCGGLPTLEVVSQISKDGSQIGCVEERSLWVSAKDQVGGHERNQDCSLVLQVSERAIVEGPVQMGGCSPDVVLKETKTSEIVTISNAIRFRVALLSGFVLDTVTAGKGAVDLERVFDTAKHGLAKTSIVELEVRLEAQVG